MILWDNNNFKIARQPNFYIKKNVIYNWLLYSNMIEKFITIFLMNIKKNKVVTVIT